MENLPQKHNIDGSRYIQSQLQRLPSSRLHTHFERTWCPENYCPVHKNGSIGNLKARTGHLIWCSLQHFFLASNDKNHIHQYEVEWLSLFLHNQIFVVSYEEYAANCDFIVNKPTSKYCSLSNHNTEDRVAYEDINDNDHNVPPFNTSLVFF